MDELNVNDIIEKVDNTNETEYDIFISYRRSDGWELAKLIKDSLSIKGYSVFLDTDDIDMKKQNNYNDVLDYRLKNCKDHIIIVSSSSFVEKEKDIYLGEIQSSLDEIENKVDKNIICYTTSNQLATKMEAKDSPSQLQKISQKTLFVIDNIEALKAQLQEVDRLLQSIPSKPYTVMASRTTVENTHSVYERLSNAYEIDVCAFGVESLFTSNSQFIDMAVDSGTKFRFLCQNPYGEFVDYISKYNIFEGSQKKRNKVIPNSHEYLNDTYLDATEPSNKKYIESFEYRVTDVYLTNSIMIVKKKAPYKSHIKVDLFVPCNDNENDKNRFEILGSRSRRCLYIEESDRENFEYYTTLFEFLWNHSKTKDGVENE